MERPMTAPLVRYRNVVIDNARWDGFELRDDDIVISHAGEVRHHVDADDLRAAGVPDAPTCRHRSISSRPGSTCRRRSSADVVADLAAQDHRRFIKTHTPSTASRSTIASRTSRVGRDPRDVAIVVGQPHGQHGPRASDASAARRGRHSTTSHELMPNGPPVTPKTRDRSVLAVARRDRDHAAGLGRLSCTTSDVLGCTRPATNVVLLHYDELKADLDGQMRRLAGVLGIHGRRGPLAGTRRRRDVRADEGERRRVGAKRQPVAVEGHGPLLQSRDDRPVARPAERRRSASLRSPHRGARRARPRCLDAHGVGPRPHVLATPHA